MANGDVTYATDKGGFPARIASGSIECDISETINVSIGFQPNVIIMALNDAGGTAHNFFMWFKGMTSGTFFEILDAGANEHAAIATVVFAGDSDESEGFTLGANPTGAADGDILYWLAMG